MNKQSNIEWKTETQQDLWTFVIKSCGIIFVEEKKEHKKEDNLLCVGLFVSAMTTNGTQYKKRHIRHQCTSSNTHKCHVFFNCFPSFLLLPSSLSFQILQRLCSKHSILSYKRSWEWRIEKKTREGGRERKRGDKTTKEKLWKLGHNPIENSIQKWGRENPISAPLETGSLKHSNQKGKLGAQVMNVFVEETK